MEMYSYSQSTLEDCYDSAKVAVLMALAEEGVIEETVAEEWSKTHTIIIRKKSFFRTLSNLWRKEKDNTLGQFSILCVKLAWGKVLPRGDEDD